jgi:hypothetical protein
VVVWDIASTSFGGRATHPSEENAERRRSRSTRTTVGSRNRHERE